MTSEEHPTPQTDEEKWQALARHEMLGEVLLKLGKLHLKQLEELVAEQQKTGKTLGEIIVSKGLMSRAEVAQALELQQQADKVATDSVKELSDKSKRP